MRGKHGGPKDPLLRTSHRKVRWNVFATWSGETRSPGAGEEAKLVRPAEEEERGETRLVRNEEEREGTSRARPKWREGLRGSKRSKSDCHEQVCGRSGIGADLTFAWRRFTRREGRGSSQVDDPEVRCTRVRTPRARWRASISRNTHSRVSRKTSPNWICARVFTRRRKLREVEEERKCVVSFLSGGISLVSSRCVVHRRRSRKSSCSGFRITRTCAHKGARCVLSCAPRRWRESWRLSARILYWRSIVLQVKSTLARPRRRLCARGIQNCEIGERFASRFAIRAGSYRVLLRF